MKKNIFTAAISLVAITFFCSAFILEKVNVKSDAKAIAELVAMFPKAENQSFELPIDAYQSAKYFQDNGDKILTSEYNKYLPFLEKHGAFSRIPQYFKPIKVIETAENYAFIYRQSRGYSDIYSDRFFVSVVTKDGKSVHHENLTVGRNSGVITFKINSNLILEKKTYDRKWVDNADEKAKYVFTLKKLESIDLKTEKPYGWQPTPIQLQLKSDKKSTKA